VLAAMEVGRIAPDDVTTVVDQIRADLVQAEDQGGRLPGQALNLLTGRPVQSLEESLADLNAVTAEQVAEAAEQACRSGLLITPAGMTADWAGYEEASEFSGHTVTGTSYRARRAAGSRLVVGAEGVSVTGADGSATVRYDECPAMLIWPDGGRRLFGPDGTVISAEPTHFRGADAAIRDLYERVPAGVRVVLPPRDAEQIPKPPYGSAVPRIWTRRWWSLTASATRRARGNDLLLLLGTIYFPILAIAGVVRLMAGASYVPTAEALLILAGAAGLAVGCYWLSRPYLRRTRGW
jgi:zinc protease